MSKPWGYVAHKNGHLGGVCVADIDRRSVDRFVSEFLSDGCVVQPVFSREEYLTVTDKLLPWRTTVQS